MNNSSPPPPARRIYEQAIALQDETARESLIMELCQGDAALRRRVDRLIQAREQSSKSLLVKALANPDGDADLTETRLTEPSLVDPFTDRSGPDTATNFQDDTNFDPASIPSYRLVRVIGEGGMGTVYLAEQTEPIRREVALKVIKPGMDSNEVIGRFEAERQALAMMDHPNIAKVLGGGTTDQGRMYFVMELVRGIPITRYCREQDLSLNDRLKLFVDLCRAVHHAHQRGIIHRDLKPGNILVTEHDGKPVVKVIDFGVAKALRGELTDRTLLTHCSQLIGTPLYMSPEQAVRSDVDVDTRSDIFSLGVILYELLTGTTPIDRRSYAQMGDETFGSLLVKQDPQRPSDRVRQLGQSRPSGADAEKTASRTFGSKLLRRELDWIVMKAIERDRGRRYGSASEMADDVRRYLAGERVVACPPSWSYRARKTASHYRLELGILALVMTALLVVAVVSRWQISAVEAARQESEIRGLHAVELLQAFKLQSALSSLRDEDLVRLRDQTKELESDPLLRSGVTFPSQFVGLLSSIANRPPDQSFTHSSAIHDLAVLPRGNAVVSVDERGEVNLWRLDDKGSPPKLIGTHDEPAHAVAVSPDGKTAVTGSTSGTICFWSLNDGSLIRKMQPVETGLETLRWSPDGQTIAAGARYSEVWVCDADGNERFRIPNDHRHESLLFTADSAELVVPTRVDIVVYDVQTGKKIRSISTAPADNVRAMCFAGQQQQWLVAGDRFSDTLTILDYVGGDLMGQVSLGRSYPRSLCVSKDGSWLRASYADGSIQLIQILPRNGGMEATGRVATQYLAHQPQQDVRLPLASVRGDKLFVSGGQDGRIQCWHQHEIRAVEVRKRPQSVTKSYLLPRSGRIHHVLRPKNELPHRDAYLFSPTIVGDLYAAASEENVIWVFRTDRDYPIAELRSPADGIRYIALGAGGNRLLASSGSDVCVWETTDDWVSNRLVNRIEIEHDVAPIFADAGKSVLVAASTNDRVFSLDTKTGKREEFVRGVGAEFLCLDATEHRLGTATRDGLQVIELATGKVVFSTATPVSTARLKFTDNGTILLQARRDASVEVWHLPSKQSLGIFYSPEVSSGWLVDMHLSRDKPRVMLEFGSDYGGVYLVVLPASKF